MKKILIMLIPVLALAAGSIGGDMLRSAAKANAEGAHADGSSAADATAATEAHGSTDTGHSEDAHGGGGHGGDGHGGDPGAAAWFTFPSQFFVPMMRNGDMGAMMIMTLTVETTEADLEPMKQQEHRLRDALLRQLMVLANTGAFDGNFTAEARLRVMREGLLKAAQDATELSVDKVLIEDIARQQG